MTERRLNEIYERSDTWNTCRSKDCRQTFYFAGAISGAAKEWSEDICLSCRTEIGQLVTGENFVEAQQRMKRKGFLKENVPSWITDKLEEELDD